MNRYAATIDNVSNESASTPSMMVIVGSAAARPELVDWVVGSRASPAENSATYAFQRLDSTAAGTGTALTEEKLDTYTPAPVGAVTADYSAEPTAYLGAKVFNFSVHMRATWRWVAQPGKGFKLPATTTDRIGIKSGGVSTAFNVEMTLMWEE